MQLKTNPMLLYLFLATVLIAACTAPTNSLPTPTQLELPGESPTESPPESPEGYSWWNQDVFYEIFVRSFYDSNGDGNGDLNGILDKLDYLNDGDPETNADLGINSLWLMPIFPSPSYHGYDVTDYLGINPDYGTIEDFKRLLDEAHQRGMHVILDLPLNHTSSQHPWFVEATNPDSPYRDYYIWAQEDPGYPGPWGQDPWHEGKKGGYYYGVFWSEMPDLNYTNPAVVEEMDQIVKFWLDMGVDGFRLDGARYIIEEGEKQADTASTHDYYKWLYTWVKGINPEALILGEVWADIFTVSTYTQEDELDLVFNFDLAEAMVSSALNGRADKVNSAINFHQKLFPKGQAAPFLTNHDQDRLMSQLKGDKEKAKNAAAMLLSAPGVPFMYYGEEIGMFGSRGNQKTDIQRRLPMQWTAGENAGFTTGEPWTSLWPFYKEDNVATQTGNANSLLAFYREWVQIRNTHAGLLYGGTSIVDTGNPGVYAILRESEQEDLLILINLSNQAVSDYTLNLKSSQLSGDYSLNSVYGEGLFSALQTKENGAIKDYQPLPELPANARYILKLQPDA